MNYGIYENGKLLAGFVVPLTFRSNRPVFSSDTLSLKRQASFQSAQRWELSAQLEPMKENAGDLFSYLVTKGHGEPMEIITPQNYGVVLARTSRSTPIATGTAGHRTVNLQSISGLIPRGTMVQFAGHSKVYMTTSDITTSGDLGIFPALIKSVSGEEMKHRDDVIMPVMLDTTAVVGMVYSDGILMDNGNLTFIEKL